MNKVVEAIMKKTAHFNEVPKKPPAKKKVAPKKKSVPKKKPIKFKRRTKFASNGKSKHA